MLWRPSISWLAGWVVAVTVTAASAQTWRYEPLEEEEDRAQELIEELRPLIDEAEQARAADRRFLWDLREVLRRYDRPWRVELFYDDFRDGEFDRSPPWTVVSGHFFVDRNYGLRSGPATRQSGQPQTQPQQPGGNEKVGGPDDELARILGTILKGGVQGQTQGQAAPASVAREAEIRAAAPITNAFHAEIEIYSTAQAATGRVEFGVFYAGENAPGYRLSYHPGRAPGLRLSRAGQGGGRSVIEIFKDSLALEDGSFHVIDWTRDRTGEMAVSIDGKELFRTVDRAYRDDFQGFFVNTKNIDTAIREITIRGTERS